MATQIIRFHMHLPPDDRASTIAITATHSEFLFHLLAATFPITFADRYRGRGHPMSDHHFTMTPRGALFAAASAATALTFPAAPAAAKNLPPTITEEARP